MIVEATAPRRENVRNTFWFSQKLSMTGSEGEAYDSIERKSRTTAAGGTAENSPDHGGDHSKTAAHCAEKIAAACGDLDPEKAYVLGLLHDIGRTFGVRAFLEDFVSSQKKHKHKMPDNLR